MPQAVPTVIYTALSSGHYQSRDFFCLQRIILPPFSLTRIQISFIMA